MLRNLLTFPMRALAEVKNSSGAPPLGNLSGGPPPGMGPPSHAAIYGITFLFSLIVIVGLIGNFLVIYVILSDRKMRLSVTNLFIINLALADFLLMVLCVPDVVMFCWNSGWLLGLAICKIQRFVLCVSLYVSVLTLVSLCVERYIAIVYPIKANIFCSKRRILACIATIWPLAGVMGIPTLLYNVVRRPAPQAPEFCMFGYPSDQQKKTIFKAMESVLFYLIPLVVQICLYTVISIRLFAGTEKLHRRQTVQENGVEKEKSSDAIKSRKQVVKMLIGCIVIYFVCYAPHCVKTLYDAVNPETPFHSTWLFQVASYALAYANSAANPLMYSVFSQNFRRKFRHALTCSQSTDGYKQRSLTLDSVGGSRANTRFTSLKQTNQSEV